MKLPKIIDYKLKQKSPENELAKYVVRLEKVLEKGVEEANNRFGEYLRQLLDKSRREEERLTDEAQKRLTEYVDAMQKDVADEIKSDMVTVKKALEDYQKIRIAQIEANIAETIQRTAEIYLGRKLDPETHMELIYESLEKAKKEKLVTL